MRETEMRQRHTERQRQREHYLAVLKSQYDIGTTRSVTELRDECIALGGIIGQQMKGKNRTLVLSLPDFN
jgi:hypothetical protein